MSPQQQEQQQEQSQERHHTWHAGGSPPTTLSEALAALASQVEHTTVVRHEYQARIRALDARIAQLEAQLVKAQAVR